VAGIGPYLATIRAASAHFGIPQGLLEKQIMVESGGDPRARSPVGALGLMQLMPGTARGLGVGNPMNPVENIMGGAKYLRDQYDRFGSWPKALAAYNAGPGAVVQAGGVPSFAQHYVNDILNGGIPPSVGAAPPAVTASAPGLSAPAMSAPAVSRLGGLPPMMAKAENLASQAQQSISLTGTGDGSTLTLPNIPGPNWQSYLPQQAKGREPSQVEGGNRLPMVGTDIPTAAKSGHGGGFLPQGAMYLAGRHDQGQDFQTNPGGPIIAPGSGVVIAVKSDPHGFGPSYPIVHFTSGPYKGQNVYIGHTISQLGQGDKFKEGEVISVTGGKGQTIGNATVPGWAEIGYANHLGIPGVFGQRVPF